MEKQKVDPILMVAAVLALITTVYVFYITVFERIISQNQGYFYAVVFAFILLVLFLLCNLFTKLIAISVGEQRSYRRLVITIGLVVIASLFLVTRMRYTTSLYPGEYPIYRGAVGMVDGTYSQSHDVIDAALANPGHYLYSLLLSIIFRFAEPGPRPVLWVNAIFIVICGALIYKIVRTFTNQMCGLFAAILCAIIPSQTFAVYSFTSEPMVAAIYLGAVLTLISLVSYNKRIKELEEYGESDKKDVAGLVFTIIGALLVGLLLFVEPFMILTVILMIAAAFISRRPKAMNMLVSFAAGIVIMVLLCFVKSAHTGVDFGTVMTSQMSAFDPATNRNSGEVSEFGDVFSSFNAELSSTDKNITENYTFISDESGAGAYTEMSASWVQVLNQIMYMFVLMMTISCMILAVKEQKDYVVTISTLIVGSVLMLLFQQNRDSQMFLVISVFIIASSTGIHYLYLDHHPELKVGINALDALEKTGRKEIAAATRTNLKNAAKMTEADFVKRANALIFVGNDEELYQQIKNEEHERALKYIDRPARKDEAAFDDYDEDFFLDKEDNADLDVKVTTVGPSGIRQSVGGDEAYTPNAEMHESASAAWENPNVPAWKRPEKFGDDEMFDEGDVELGKEHSSFEGKKSLYSTAGVTTSQPEPEVEKIKRNTKKVVSVQKKAVPEPVNKEELIPAFLKKEYENSGYDEPVPTPVAEVVSKDDVIPAKEDKKALKAKAKKEKGGKILAAPAKSTISGGKAVRRIKSVGSDNATVKTVSAKKTVAEEPVKPSAPIPNPLPVPKKKDHKPIEYDKKITTKADDDWDYDYMVDDNDDWDV